MALYVILNFEDPDAGYTGGPVKGFSTRKATNLPANVVGSAQATVKGTVLKAKRKQTTFGRNTVRHYSCVEIARADKLGNLDRSDVEAIRKDCEKAKKIYIIMHGKPDETEKGFSNPVQGVQQEYAWADLGRLALLLFPKSGGTYSVSLVMCYGARTATYRLNQNGTLPAGELKSSFAYKFFRQLCVARNVRMTAVTGAVSTNDDGTNVVESEEWVSATLDMIDYKKDTATRSALDTRKKIEEAGYPGGKTEWAALCQKFALNGDEDPGTDPLKIFLKQYYYEKVHRNASLRSAKTQAAQVHGGQSNVAKYGRIVYSYNGGLLTIVNKYGDPNNPVVGANHLLYSGALL